MKLTLARKLNLAFLGLTLIVLVATLGLARWSFERGFLDYVNALEQNRLKFLAEDISIEYVLAGNSWDGFTEEQFIRILDLTSPTKMSRGIGFGFPPPPSENPKHPSGSDGSQVKAPIAGPSADHRLKRNQQNIGPPTALYDTNDNLIAGHSLESSLATIGVQITVLDEVVGKVKSVPRRHFSSVQETAFSKQQLYTSSLIGIISLTLALVVSYILTRLLLQPITRMINGVSALSSGDYSQRLSENRNDELGRLMLDLDKLAIQLEENRSSRKRWLADISQELRTPITVLTGEIETMKDGIRPIDLKQILSLDQEVVRLRRLINDLYELSVSDIGGLRYNFQSTDILKLIHNQVESQQTFAKEKGIKILLNHPESIGLIRADAVRLEQLFSNLVSNSLHYTDSPGTMEIQISQSNGKVCVVFSDTSPSVSESDCEKLFAPLYRQESSRSRRTAGAGLGLAICSNTVKAHQGSIVATPSNLGGLTITMNFPLFTGN